MRTIDLAPMRKQKGEVGIEIEVEGNSLPEEIVGWSRVHDGSLRGESCEFVLKTPSPRDKLDVCIGRMADAYEKNETEVKESARQSIHIHINVQELTIPQVYNFITLFLILEHPLVEFCGEHRAGNLFCLRSEDAEGLLTALEDAATVDTIHQLNTDKLRYSALNVAALFKYGSLEFRSMRGTGDFALIRQWIDILLSIKDAALDYDNPVDILSDFSKTEDDDFIKSILKDNADVVLKQEGWVKTIYNNMRSLQMMVYSGEWDELRDKEEVPKPEKEQGIGLGERILADERARRERERLDRLLNEAVAAPPPQPEIRKIRTKAPAFFFNNGVEEQVLEDDEEDLW